MNDEVSAGSQLRAGAGIGAGVVLTRCRMAEPPAQPRVPGSAGAVRRVGGAVILCSFTTTVGDGSLLVADNQALESSTSFLERMIFIFTGKYTDSTGQPLVERA